MKKLINWFRQYGYYYKYAFVTVIFAVALIVFGLVSCLSKTDYDMTVILSGDFYIYDVEVMAYEEVLADYIEDYNGDGKVNVQVIGLSTASGSAELNYSYEQRFQAEILTGEVTLFFTDAKKQESLAGIEGVADATQYLPEGYVHSGYFSVNGSAFAQKVADKYSELYGGDGTPTEMIDDLRMFLRAPVESKAKSESYELAYSRAAGVFSRIAAGE